MRSAKAVAPVAALASLIASITRLSLFWCYIDWQMVRWYVPGAVFGATAGGWASRIDATVLQFVIAVFLISTVGYRWRSVRNSGAFSSGLSPTRPIA